MWQEVFFFDAKSDRNFHDFYTVIMGHHMQGRKMFGDIDLYTDVSFFEKIQPGHFTWKAGS